MSAKAEIITYEPKALASVSNTLTPMEMLATALQGNKAPDVIERLMDLVERWQKGEAKRAFYQAKAAFKANPPTVLKDKTNQQYKSKYTSIDEMVGKVNAALAPYGLEASWEIEQPDGKVRVTCILTHVDGHSERAEITAPPDTSGAKNPIQQIKSTMTYLKLATYEAVIGIASREGNADDDGNGSTGGGITEDQQDTLIALADEVGADKPRFCRYFKINSIADLPASRFKEAVDMLEAKRGKK